MAAAGLILFDDHRALSWEPFALTRPIGELRFGTTRLVERAERLFGLECIGYLTSEHLKDFQESGAAGVIGIDDLPQDRELIFWCARAAAELDQQILTAPAPALYLMDGQPVGCRVPAGQRPDQAFLADLDVAGARGAEVKVEGRLLEWLWDVMLQAPEQVARDLATAEPSRPDLPDGVYVLGDGALLLGRDVHVEPGVVFDTRDGPIRIGDTVEIRAGARIAGPADVGANSRLLGGSYEAFCAGPVSYLRGEVAESVVLGYTNKAHDGHIGHAYIGKWVNLGAFTTNSDLKNNYGPVKVWTPSGLQNTGQKKIGCFLGDHVKTGIGLLISTGTVVGAGANIYGSSMPPRYVQPFSWGQGNELGEYRLTEFLETAGLAMGRRGVDLDERGRRYLESCWRRGRGG